MPVLCRLAHEDNLPDEWKEYTELNAKEAPQCPVVTEKKDAVEGADCEKKKG